MNVIEWAIEIVAIAILLVNVHSFRTRVRSGVGVSPPSSLMLTLLIISVVFVHSAGVSRFHLLWLFPACVLIGVTRLPFPLSIVYVPSYFVGRVLALGAYQGGLAGDVVAFGGALAAPLQKLSILRTVAPLAVPFEVVCQLGSVAGLGLAIHALTIKQFVPAAIALASMGVFFLASHCLDRVVIEAARPLIEKVLPGSSKTAFSRTRAMIAAAVFASAGALMLWWSVRVR